MKRFIYSIFAILLLAVSCEKDGDKLIVTEPGAPSDFSASSTEIVLSSDGVDALALSLFWNAGALPEVSDPTVALPDDLTELSIQFSAQGNSIQRQLVVLILSVTTAIHQAIPGTGKAA